MVSRKAEDHTVSQSQGEKSADNEKKLIAEAVKNALALLDKMRSSELVKMS
jgi:hypothetical protein